MIVVVSSFWLWVLGLSVSFCLLLYSHFQQKEKEWWKKSILPAGQFMLVTGIAVWIGLFTFFLMTSYDIVSENQEPEVYGYERPIEWRVPLAPDKL